MKLMVTGATGLVGGGLVRESLRRGDEVTALVRSAERAAPLQEAGARLVEGDISQGTHLDDACAGADVVVHCAARSGDRGSRSLFERTNEEGTKVVFDAAVRAGVRRFVFVSTISVYGYGRHLGDEADELAEMAVEHSYPYSLSKMRAERALSARSGELELTICRLGSVFGPGSQFWNVEASQLLARQTVPLVNGGDGIWNYVYLDDAVAGLRALATDPAAAGEVFHLVAGHTTYREYMQTLAEALGIDVRFVAIPFAVVFPSSFVLAGISRLTGGDPLITPIFSRVMRRKVRYGSAKIRGTLGWEPTVGLDAGLRTGARWLREAGVVKLPN